MGLVINHGSPLFDALAGAGGALQAHRANNRNEAEEVRRQELFEADLAAAAQDLDARRSQEADRQRLLGQQEASADALRRGYEYIAKFQGNDLESGPAARAIESGMSRDDVAKRLRREKLGTLTEIGGSLQPDHLEQFWQSALQMLGDDEDAVEGQKLAERLQGIPPEMIDPQVAQDILAQADGGDVLGASERLSNEILRGVERQRAVEQRLGSAAQVRSWADGFPTTNPINMALSTIAGLLETDTGADVNVMMREALDLAFFNGKKGGDEPFDQSQWALETLAGIVKSNPEILMTGELDGLYQQLLGLGGDPFAAFGEDAQGGAEAFMGMAEKVNEEGGEEGGGLDLPNIPTPQGIVGGALREAASGPGGARLATTVGAKTAEAMLDVGRGLQAVEAGAKIFAGAQKRRFDRLLGELADLLE